MAQGIRQGMCDAVPKMCGNELENEGAAWIEQKWFLPMLSLRPLAGRQPRDAPVREAKRGLGLVVRNAARDPADVPVKGTAARSAPP